MGKLKSKKGITLIALIITIIVMLILVGVTVSVSLNGGLFKTAKQATDNTQLETDKEELFALAIGAIGNNGKVNFEKLNGSLGNKFTIKDGMYVSKSNNSFKVLENGTVEYIETVEKLQEKYEFAYYSKLSSAIADVNNNAIGVNADSNKEEATAGIYTNNGKTYVVLIKDTTENDKIIISKDLTLNLGGNTLNFTSSGIDTVNNNNNTIVIDGNLDGSTISCIGTHTTAIAAIQVRGGNNITIDSVTLNTVAENCVAHGVYLPAYSENPSNCVISDCNINVSTATSNKAYGIANHGNLTVTDSTVKAYSNYNRNESGGFAAVSQGISTADTSSTVLYNCNVMGTHSGVQSKGTLIVDGGIYEGVGYGGICFFGAETTSYVQNAILRECEMPEGYESNCEHEDEGFRIGGNVGINVTVYMDNCDIYGSKQPIVLKGGQNNKLYISNSKVNLNPTWGIRVDNNTHRLYIGRGNNFTKENIDILNSTITTEDIEQIVINTNEEYKKR